jgi:hypothetical protein
MMFMMHATRPTTGLRSHRRGLLHAQCLAVCRHAQCCAVLHYALSHANVPVMRRLAQRLLLIHL